MTNFKALRWIEQNYIRWALAVVKWYRSQNKYRCEAGEWIKRWNQLNKRIQLEFIMYNDNHFPGRGWKRKFEYINIWHNKHNSGTLRNCSQCISYCLRNIFFGRCKTARKNMSSWQCKHREMIKVVHNNRKKVSCLAQLTFSMDQKAHFNQICIINC